MIDLIEKTSSREYCLLLSLLEFKDFDINELERLCKCQNFDENVLKFKIINFISKMKESEEKVLQQEENIRNLQLQFEEFQRQNKQLVDLISTKLTDFVTFHQNSINEFKTQIKQQNDDNSASIEKILVNQQNSIKEFKDQIKQQIDDKLTNVRKMLTEQQN